MMEIASDALRLKLDVLVNSVRYIAWRIASCGGSLVIVLDCAFSVGVINKQSAFHFGVPQNHSPTAMMNTDVPDRRW